MSGNDKQDFIEKCGWFEREEVLGLNLIPSARDVIETVLASEPVKTRTTE
ncbi:hypothetical protein [Nonomuraea salmonea]|uniref:Uncharacterized protein n=1 Tax=Nonomuraea salmonea TaxID=46181 RepID=A0ABV5NQF4_9ACTN